MTTRLPGAGVREHRLPLGPATALTTLEQEVGTETNSATGSRTTSARPRSPATTATSGGRAEGSSTCASGYYHGVLSRALVNVKSYEASALGAVARGLCRRGVPRSRRARVPVPARLGHGLMITTGYNLPTSLEVCDHLRGSGTRRRATAASSWRTSSRPTAASRQKRRSRLPVQRGRRGGQADLLSARHLPDPPCHRSRLGEDRGDLCLGREELGRVVLRVTAETSPGRRIATPRRSARPRCETVRRRAGVHPLRGAGHGAERQDRKAGGRPLRRCDRRTALGVL